MKWQNHWMNKKLNTSACVRSQVGMIRIKKYVKNDIRKIIFMQFFLNDLLKTICMHLKKLLENIYASLNYSGCTIQKEASNEPRKEMNLNYQPLIRMDDDFLQNWNH